MPGRLVHIPIWWVIVGVASCVLTPILSILVSVQIADRNRIQQEQQAAKVAAELRAEGVERYCRLFGSQVDVYSDATSPVGIEAHRAWLTEYKKMGCKPPK